MARTSADPSGRVPRPAQLGLDPSGHRLGSIGDLPLVAQQKGRQPDQARGTGVDLAADLSVHGRAATTGQRGGESVLVERSEPHHFADPLDQVVEGAESGAGARPVGERD